MAGSMSPFDKIPERIGKYKIESIIGMGGMGVIYKAIQEPLGRKVALKVLLPASIHSDESARRFELEAHAISRLQHHNIVNIYEYGQDGDYIFFAMQYVDGEDLAKRIARKKQLSYAEIIDYAKQICRGLKYAHEQNVVHRDIKPQNILLDNSQKALISDFGIARIFKDQHITMTGMAVGTPEYMSPEQAQGKQPDCQTDIYSLGCVLYEMITRDPPFTGDNAVGVAYKQVHELPIPPSAKRKDIPKRLELIILKALKKDKAERYLTISDMLAHLDTVDIDDVSDCPTKTIAQPSAAKKDATDDANRRITDRRNGNRSTTGSIPIIPFEPFNPRFWLYTMQTQWLSLVFVLALAIILMLHLAGK